jgi:hypothetical protein
MHSQRQSAKLHGACNFCRVLFKLNQCIDHATICRVLDEKIEIYSK